MGSFHGLQNKETQSLQLLLNAHPEHTFILVKGNHDFDLPEWKQLTVVDQWQVGPLVCLHEPPGSDFDTDPDSEVDPYSDKDPCSDMDPYSDMDLYSDMDPCSDMDPYSDMDLYSDIDPDSDMDPYSDMSPYSDMDPY